MVRGDPYLIMRCVGNTFPADRVERFLLAKLLVPINLGRLYILRVSGREGDRSFHE